MDELRYLGSIFYKWHSDSWDNKFAVRRTVAGVVMAKICVDAFKEIYGRILVLILFVGNRILA